MKKRLLAFLVCLAVSKFGWTQVEKVVQVIADDTLQVVPDEIIYQISINDYNVYAVDTLTTDEMSPIKRPTNKTAAEVRRIIRELRLDSLQSNKLNLRSGRGNYNDGEEITVRFTSLAQLQSFLARVKSFENLQGKVVTVKTNREQYYRQVLMERLMKKARADAEVLAQLNGRQIIEVVSVKEEADASGLGGLLGAGLLNELYGQLGLVEQTKVVLRRRMMVQFTWR